MKGILGILFIVCSVCADTFVLSQEPQTHNQIGFVEGNSYPLQTQDFRLGAYNENFALYIISQALQDFIEGKNLESTDKIRIIRTKNGFISTRSDSNSYYTSNNKTNLYAQIAPKIYALKAVKPDILVIENFSKDIIENYSCVLIRSNVFIRNASRPEIILDWNKNYARDSQNIVFSLECDKDTQEAL